MEEKHDDEAQRTYELAFWPLLSSFDDPSAALEDWRAAAGASKTVREAVRE